MIDALTTQNSELRTMLIKSSEKVGNNGLSPMEVDTEKDELVILLNTKRQNSFTRIPWGPVDLLLSVICYVHTMNKFYSL